MERLSIKWTVASSLPIICFFNVVMSTSVSWGRAMKCEPPLARKNTQVYIRKVGTRETALFECDEGYQLIPNISTIFCSEEGTWNDTEPRCAPVSCGDPGTPMNGYRDGSLFTFGNTVTFQCDIGYRIRGGFETIRCQSNKRWSSVKPYCEACPVNFYMNDDRRCAKCPEHSHTVTDGSSWIVQCLCDVGFIGPPGGPCEKVLCTKLTAPDNGDVSACGNQVGDVCDFTCNDGFVVERGSTRRTCLNTGQWDGSEPFCGACALNTYKSGERSCSACPRHSHTDGAGQMLTGCLCDDGYEGPAGGPCRDINECLANNGTGPCSDRCENLQGGFRCYCDIPGYKIDPRNPLSCIVEKTCRNLTQDDAPKNGGLVCHWYQERNEQHCMPKCNPGYEFQSRVHDYEVCGPSTGYTWTFQIMDPLAKMYPCIPEFSPDFRLAGDSTYFVSDCGNLTETQKTAAKEEFASLLNRQGVCSSRQTKICEVKDMRIICDNTTRTRRRRGVDYLEQSVDFSYNATAFMTQDSTKQKELSLQVDGVKSEPQEEGLASSQVIKECPSGMMSIKEQCVPCMAGSYLNEDNECEKCPPNYYQNLDRQISCISCKVKFGPGFYTPGIGSSKCEVCPDGRWGVECLEVCDCAHGSCSPISGRCICPAGWEGDHCEKDINMH